MDFEQIKKVSEGYRADMTRFLREMISYPSCLLYTSRCV